MVEVLGVSANELFLCGNNWAVFVWKKMFSLVEVLGVSANELFCLETMACFCVEKLRLSLVEVLGVSANELFLCGNNWTVFVWKHLGFLWLRS